MKKSLKVFLVVVILLVIAVGGFVLYTISSQNLKPLTSEEFIGAMENSNYTVSDVIDQYSKYDYVKNAYVASTRDYQIEFFVLSDDEHAIGFFNINKANFEVLASNTATSSFADVGNCSRYTLVSNGQYMYISRIGNTVIYINSPTTYQETIQALLSSLGY